MPCVLSASTSGWHFYPADRAASIASETIEVSQHVGRISNR
jgi:hypothetical protein